MTIEPNDRQVAGNAKSILEIQVKSEVGDVAALDNVARFAGNEASTGEGCRLKAEPRRNFVD